MSIRKLSPWLALAIPFVLYGVLAFLRALDPSLFCVAVNPGGKEFVCGPSYSHVGVRLITSAGLIAWFFVLVFSGMTVLRGKATRASAFAWSISAVLLLALAVLWLTRPVQDSP